MSRTTARTAAMQMIFERTSGGQGGEETLRMVYDELRELNNADINRISEKEPEAEDREYRCGHLYGGQYLKTVYIRP